MEKDASERLGLRVKGAPRTVEAAIALRFSKTVEDALASVTVAVLLLLACDDGPPPVDTSRLSDTPPPTEGTATTPTAMPSPAPVPQTPTPTSLPTPDPVSIPTPAPTPTPTATLMPTPTSTSTSTLTPTPMPTTTLTPMPRRLPLPVPPTVGGDEAQMAGAVRRGGGDRRQVAGRAGLRQGAVLAPAADAPGRGGVGNRWAERRVRQRVRGTLWGVSGWCV